MNYSATILPEPYRIMGISLKPFTLGHYFLLQKFGCGFVSDNPENKCDITDLIVGIAICSHDYSDFEQKYSSGKIFKWLNSWGKQLNKQLNKQDCFNLLEKFELFKQYIKTSCHVPMYWKNQDESESVEKGAHWSAHLLNILTSKLNYTREKAFDLQMSNALTEYLVYCEAEGAITLIRDDELEMMAANTKKKELVNGNGQSKN